MKAKEYAAQYNAATDQGAALAEIANGFVREFGRMALARKIQKPASCLSLVREFENKWQRFVELIDRPDVCVDGFRLLLAEANPEFYGKLLAAEGLSITPGKTIVLPAGYPVGKIEAERPTATYREFVEEKAKEIKGGTP